MMKFSDLSNELVLMIWDLVELEDVYSFSTISKNVYLLTQDLLREHSRLHQRLSTINSPGSELRGPGVYGRVLKEVLLNPRASRYPLSLKVDSWEFEWEDGPYPQGMVPESDLALFKQAVRENVDVSEKDLEEDWLAEIDKGNEEPLIALLLLLLPNLRDVEVGSILTDSPLCIYETLNRISSDGEESRSLRKLRSVGLEYLVPDGDLMDFDYIRLFAALPSVTSITGCKVGSDPDDLLRCLPSRLYSTNLTDLSFAKCGINSKTLADFLSKTWKLERFLYQSDASLVNAADFDPFWIRHALLANNHDTLKSLTLLADAGTRHYMGSLADFECLEFLETDFRFLIGDPSTSYHTPSMVLPTSMVRIKLHINYTADGSYYQASLQDIADHPNDFERLEEITVVGVADVRASTISLSGITSVLVRTSPAHYAFIQANRELRNIVSGLPCSFECIFLTWRNTTGSQRDQTFTPRDLRALRHIRRERPKFLDAKSLAHPALSVSPSVTDGESDASDTARL